jgi:Protein of unknown function (DUF3551)
MNKAVIAVGVAVLTAAMLKPAVAQLFPSGLFPYCAWYSDHSTNCGFPTLWSCQASVSGVGGYCGPNPRWTAQRPPAYSDPAGDPRRRRPPPSTR